MAASRSAAAALDAPRLSAAAVDAYFGTRTEAQLVKHQVDGFDNFVQHKLESIVDGFNPIDMNNTWMPEHGKYKYVLSVRLSDVKLAKPLIVEKDGSTKLMFPNDARLRNLTYAGQLSADVHVTARTFSAETHEYVDDTKRITNVALGRLPIMVGSRHCMLRQHASASGALPPHDECRHDQGGYFIVNGNEKVVISQDRIAENRTYVFLSTKATSYSHVAEIRSVPEARYSVPKTTTLRLTSKATQFGRCVRMTLHHVRHDVPVFIVFRALGVVSDRAIVRAVVGDEADPAQERVVRELAGCADEASDVRTQAEALEYMAAHLNHVGHHVAAGTTHGRVAALQAVLRKDVLPHVGADPLRKAAYLGHMLLRLLRGYLELDPLDDRDSFINKRLDGVGSLMASLVRQYYGKVRECITRITRITRKVRIARMTHRRACIDASQVVKDLRTQVQRDIKSGAWRATQKLVHVVHRSNIHKLIKSTIIETGLKSSLATGNWGVKTGRVRPGVAQVLNRMTYMSTLSHMRRVNTPIEKTGKLVQPRKLHPTQWGVICPAETPEGASVGLVKNLALLTHISVATPSQPVRDAMASLGVRFTTEPAHLSRGALRIFLNGDPVGTHGDPAALHAALRALKRTGGLSVFASIVWDIRTNQLTVCTEGGRFMRPLFVVRDGRLVLEADFPDVTARLLEGARIDWVQDLVLAGAVEYLDVEEMNVAMIAMTPDDLRRGGHAAPCYTHVELAPGAMLGVVAGSIPFSEHNQVSSGGGRDDGSGGFELRDRGVEIGLPHGFVLGVFGGALIALVLAHHGVEPTPGQLAVVVQQDVDLGLFLIGVGAQLREDGHDGTLACNASPLEAFDVDFGCARQMEARDAPLVISDSHVAEPTHAEDAHLGLRVYRRHAPPKLARQCLTHGAVFLRAAQAVGAHAAVRVQEAGDVGQGEIAVDRRMFGGLHAL